MRGPSCPQSALFLYQPYEAEGKSEDGPLLSCWSEAAPGASPPGEFQSCCLGLCLPQPGPAGLQGPVASSSLASRGVPGLGRQGGSKEVCGLAVKPKYGGPWVADGLTRSCVGGPAPHAGDSDPGQDLRVLGPQSTPPTPRNTGCVSRKDRAGAKGGCDAGAVAAGGGAGGLDRAGPVLSAGHC